ncbi:MAG: hypothetical protein ACE5HT_03480 [Gemmatimonadales bacterium]
MPELTIELKKTKDGSTALSCKRADGSVTWQHHKATQGPFFSLHDLTHYAVETVLGYREGFFGLVAGGWDISDFEKRGAIAMLPREAQMAEVIVGFLDTERASRSRWPAADFNAHLATHCAQHGIDHVAQLTDDSLNRTRDLRSKLFARWGSLAIGETLTLEFARGDRVS